MKLTAKQRAALSNPDGIYRNFDVWDGYWYTYGHGVAVANKQTIESLISRGMVDVCQTERVFSGRQIAPLLVTDAGRQSLAEAEAEDG